MSLFKPPIPQRNRRSVSSDGIRRQIGAIPPRSPSPSSSSSGGLTGIPSQGLNLTPEQELEILERLERGDWKPGVGWKQFLPTPINRGSRSPRSISRFSRSQSIPNLSKAFEALEKEEATPNNANLSIYPNPENNSSLSLSLDEELAQYNIVKEDLPEYQQQAIKLMDEVDNYQTTIFKTLSTVKEQESYECFPLTKLADKMDQAMLVLKQMMSPKSKPFYNSLLLKSSSEHAKEISIPIPLQKQKECIESFAALSKNLEAVNTFLEGNNTLNLEKGIRKMEKMIEALENDLKLAANNSATLEYYRAIAFQIEGQIESAHSDSEE